MKKQVNFARPIFFLLLFIAIIISGAVLKATAPVVLPLTLAVLLSCVLDPLISALHKRFRVPWGLGIGIVITILFIGIYTIGSLLFASFKTIITVYPRYEERFMIIYQTEAHLFDLPSDAENSLFENLWGQLSVRSAIQMTALSLSNSLLTFFKNTLMVFLFAIFFLAEMQAFRIKIGYVLAEGHHSNRFIRVLKDIILQVTRYLSVKFFISLLTGIFVLLGCLFIRLDFAIVWGFLAFVLNFIPNFGSIASGIMTTAFALVQFWPEPGPVIFTGCLMLGVNMVLGNVIEPRVQGSQLGLSPFVILASLSVWGWIWDFTGLILAVPMMVILKIICENISFLHPVSVLMGQTPTKESLSALGVSADGREWNTDQIPSEKPHTETNTDT